MILDLIKKHALEKPNKIAYSNRFELLTYKELWDLSDIMAANLLDLYPKDKSPIVVFGHKQKEMVIAFIACAKIGRAYIPIDDSFPESRVRDIMESAESNLMIEVSESELETQKVDPFNLLNKKLKMHSIDAKAILYIIYTSGSTGRPKGVQISHQNLDAFLKWLDAKLALDDDVIVMGQAPFSFDLSVMDLYLSLMKGLTLFEVDHEMIANPRLMFTELKKRNIGFWISTPSLVEYCVADRDFNKTLLPKLKGFLFIGEIFSKSCAQKLIERFEGAFIYNGYGPTECTVMNTLIKITPDMVAKYETLPIGYEENGVLCIDDEIVISGLAVSVGYLNDAERTSRVFKNGRYFTGDVGYIKDGLLFFAGRKDNQIKLSGYRIELEDIESKLRLLPYVTIGAVLPKMKNHKCEMLIAFVALSSGDGKKIKADLKKLLPAYMVPNKIKVMDKLPIGATGKIDRNKLKEMV